MRSVFVVIPPPGRDADSRFGQRTEPVLIEAFVPELTVERLDEGILRGLTRLNQLQLDVALIGPLIECLAGELGPLVGADRFRVAAKPRHLVQRPCDAKAADTVLHQDADRLLGEVIDHRQAFDPPPGAQCIEDEVHRPDLV